MRDGLVVITIITNLARIELTGSGSESVGNALWYHRVEQLVALVLPSIQECVALLQLL